MFSPTLQLTYNGVVVNHHTTYNELKEWRILHYKYAGLRFKPMHNNNFITLRSLALIAIFIVSRSSVFAQASDINKLRIQLKNATDDSVKVDVYNNIYNYYQYADADSAIYYLQDGLKQFNEKNYRYGIASLTELLGGEYITMGRMELAKATLHDALKIFENLGNRNGIATTNNSLGIIESKSGNFDEAVKRFMVALKIFQADSNMQGVIGTYLKLGVVHEISNNLDKALEYYNKALSLTPDTPITRSQVYLYNNIGIVYGKKGNLQTSLQYFRKALANCNTAELIGVRIRSLMNMGIVYHEFGKDDTALMYYNQALQVTKEKNLSEEYARTLINIANITSKTNPSKSIVQLNEALGISKKLGQKAMIEDIYNGLVDDYKKTGNLRQALTLMEQLRDLEDSMYQVEKDKEIANLESVYDLDQSNARIKELKLNEQKNIQKRNITILVAIVLLLALILISFYYRKSKLLNEKLSKREAELAKSNTVKDKLFSIIGHDLRGPLGNIPMMLQILEDETTTPDERRYLLDTMSEHVKASMETLDKLLYWGKSQIKGRGLKPEAFKAGQYLQSTIKLIKSSADQKHISIINNVQEDLTVYGDPAHFDFIIRNLLSNAIKFTHANGMIEISAGDSKRKEGFVVFAVKDNGVGMPKDKQAAIFESFSSSTMGTANEKGTSMGLILCKEFVSENGGDISVESESGKGSTFYFTFKKA